MLKYKGVATIYQQMLERIANTTNDACWEPLGRVEPSGYWKVCAKGKQIWAHRAAFIIANGYEPFCTDHLCRTRSCWNPEHLEEVTKSENSLRAVPYGTMGKGQRKKTHCPKGHPYNAENTRYRANGHRLCRQCSRDWMRERRGRN